MKTCPAGFFCVDGINSVSCLPEAPNKVQNISSMEGVSPTEPLERGLLQAQPSYLSADVSGPQRFTGKWGENMGNLCLVASSFSNYLHLQKWWKSNFPTSPFIYELHSSVIQNKVEVRYVQLWFHLATSFNDGFANYYAC